MATPPIKPAVTMPHKEQKVEQPSKVTAVAQASLKRTADEAGPSSKKVALSSDSLVAKAAAMPGLQPEHKEFMRGFVTEFHEISTVGETYYCIPVLQSVSLKNFFERKKKEIEPLTKQVSPIAAFKFLHSEKELKEKTIKACESFSFVTWTAFDLFVSSMHGELYTPEVEKTTEVELSALLAMNDPMIRHWRSETILDCIKNQKTKELIKHIFPEANI